MFNPREPLHDTAAPNSDPRKCVRFAWRSLDPGHASGCGWVLHRYSATRPEAAPSSGTYAARGSEAGKEPHQTRGRRAHHGRRRRALASAVGSDDHTAYAALTGPLRNNRTAAWRGDCRQHSDNP